MPTPLLKSMAQAQKSINNFVGAADSAGASLGGCPDMALTGELKDFILPLDLITQTIAILARKLVGKTYTASVIGIRGHAD